VAEVPVAASGWRADDAIRQVGFRADGTLLAREDRVVSLLDARGMRALRRFEGARAFSADGEWVAGAVPDRGVVEVHAVGRDEAPATIEVGRIEGLAIAPNGSRIAVTTASHTMRIIEIAPRRSNVQIDSTAELVSPWFADEHTIVLLDANAGAPWKAYEAGDGRFRADLEATDGFVSDGWRVWPVAIGFAVARAAGASVERVVDLGESTRDAAASGPVVDRTGQRLAFSRTPWTAGRGRPEVVVVSLSTGATDLVWPGVQGPLAFSADGTRLAVGDGDRVRVLDLATRTERTGD